MVRKLIAFSFEPESIGGFAVVCNGVHFKRNGAFSHCYPLTKAAFIEAMKDRIKFNDLLGIDVRDGWQNALKDAIEPFTTMTEECDPAVAADTVAKADVNIRGEEAVSKDMEILDNDNKKLADVVTEEITKKPAKNKKVSKKTKVKKEESNDVETGKEVVADSIENTGCEESDGLSADGTSTPDNA